MIGLFPEDCSISPKRRHREFESTSLSPGNDSLDFMSAPSQEQPIPPSSQPRAASPLSGTPSTFDRFRLSPIRAKRKASTKTRKESAMDDSDSVTSRDQDSDLAATLAVALLEPPAEGSHALHCTDTKTKAENSDKISHVQNCR